MKSNTRSNNLRRKCKGELAQAVVDGRIDPERFATMFKYLIIAERRREELIAPSKKCVGSY